MKIFNHLIHKEKYKIKMNIPRNKHFFFGQIAKFFKLKINWNKIFKFIKLQCINIFYTSS